MLRPVRFEGFTHSHALLRFFDLPHQYDSKDSHDLGASLRFSKAPTIRAAKNSLQNRPAEARL